MIEPTIEPTAWTGMNPVVKARWLTALRSGEYQQGRELLAQRDADNRWSYCCLGVLCELAVADGVVEPTGCSCGSTDDSHDDNVDPHRRYYGGFDTVLPPAVVRWADLPTDNPIVAGTDLATCNDGRGVYVDGDGYAAPPIKARSFSAIADLIEEEL